MNKKDSSWNILAEELDIHNHDFAREPIHFSAALIKKCTGNQEPRIICYHSFRKDRPVLLQELGLFILPERNGHYVILRGEGFCDIPRIESEPIEYTSELDFPLKTSKVGNSEMQYLDFAYATSFLRTYLEDDTLLLTIRGRKRTPRFEFRAGGHTIEVTGVQTEVDAGYEGRNSIILVEAKNNKQDNFNIRQLYYPYRKWVMAVDKPIKLFFFSPKGKTYSLWEYQFQDIMDFHSIKLVNSVNFRIENGALGA